MTIREHLLRVGKNPWAGKSLGEPMCTPAYQATPGCLAEANADLIAGDVAWLLSPETSSGVLSQVARHEDDTGRAVIHHYWDTVAIHHSLDGGPGSGFDIVKIDRRAVRHLLAEWAAWLELTRPALASTEQGHASADKRASPLATLMVAGASCRALASARWMSVYDRVASLKRPSRALNVLVQSVFPARETDDDFSLEGVLKPTTKNLEWWPEVAASLEPDLAELSNDAAATGYLALDDARRLAGASYLPRPDTWNMSEEGVLSFEWDRGERAGFIIVLSGGLEASFSVRLKMFFDVMEDFRVDEGLPLHAREALGELPRH